FLSENKHPSLSFFIRDGRVICTITHNVRSHQQGHTMTSIFEYRGLIANFIKRDISQKYVGSLLGLYWSVVNPIITLLIYILVFGVFLKVRLPGDTDIWDFALYFAAGFL